MGHGPDRGAPKGLERGQSGLPTLSFGFVAEYGLIIFVATLLGGISGYGSSLIALPYMVWMLGDAHLCAQALLITGLTQSTQLVVKNWRQVQWPVVGWMIFFAGLGLPVGYFWISHLPQKTSLLVLGTVVFLGGFPPMFGKPISFREGMKRPVSAVLFALGGVIQGAYTAGGGPIVIGLFQLVRTKELFRGTLLAFWTLVNGTLLVANTVDRAMMTQSWTLGLIGIPFVFLGGQTGQNLASKLSQRRFEQFVGGLLVVSGFVMVARNL